VKRLATYLSDIRENPAAGWGKVYFDLFNRTLYTHEAENIARGADNYGEDTMFEALLVSSGKDINTREGSALPYILAVAKNLWKESIRAELESEKSEIRMERARRIVKEDNAHLAGMIEEAKRRALLDG